MPISMDQGFAGALGVEIGVGAQMADQFDRLGKALERRRDPLTRIGLDTFNTLRDMAAALQAPPSNVAQVAVVNLGFLELIAGGLYVFAILIYLKLHEIGGALWALNQKMTVALGHLAHLITLGEFCANALLAIQAYAMAIHFQLQFANQFLAIMATLLAQILAAIAGLSARITVDHNVNITGLSGFDVWSLAAGLTALAAALGAVTLAAAPAAAALALLAGAIRLVAAALNAMPANTAEILKSLAWLAAGMIAFLGALALIGSTGKGLMAMVVGVAASVGLLFGVAYALKAMPDDPDKFVTPVLKLLGAIGLLSLFLSRLDRGAFWQVIGGLAGIAAFMLLLAAAMRIFDEQALKAMEALPGLFDALKGLGDKIVELEPHLQTIGLAFLGIVVFIGLLGLALRLFPDSAAPALQAMDGLFASLGALAKTIVELDASGSLWTVAAGLLGIVVFVGLLGLALMLFDAQAVMATQAIASLIGAFQGLIATLAGLSWEQLLLIGVGMGIMTASIVAISLAAALAGPSLGGMAEVLTAMNTLLTTVATNAGKLASALSSIPSISLPSLGGVGAVLDSLQTGGPIEQTGPYMLHEGEYVLNPADTAALTAAGGRSGTSDNSISVGSVQVTVNAQSVDRDGAAALGDEIVRRIASRLAELHREDAFASGVRLQG